MKTICLTLALVVAVAGYSDPVHSCTCMPMSLAEHYEATDVVFDGYPTVVRLVEIRHPQGVVKRQNVEFRTMSWWKGKPEATVTVQTGIGGGDCGSEFRVGTRYIVFARAYRDELVTGICSGNIRHIEAELGGHLSQLTQLAIESGRGVITVAPAEPIPRYVFPILCAVGALHIALGIPLIRRRIKPNWFYGVRLPATLEDESVWYDINALGGWCLAWTGVVYVVLVTIAWVFGDGWRPEVRVIVPLGFLVVAVVASCIVLGAAANRLLKQRRASQGRR